MRPMKRILVVFALIACSLFVFTMKNAVAIYINFTDQSSFGVADGESSFYTSVEGIAFTINAYPSPDATLTWNAGDGLGINSSYEDDEIEGNEKLEIIFDSNIMLNGIFLTDFFIETWKGYTYAETGKITLYGNNFSEGYYIKEIYANSSQGTTNGEFEWILDQPLLINRIVFEALGKVGVQNHEYSLAGLDISKVDVIPEPIPEPETFILLGTSILGFLVFRRKIFRFNS